MKNNLWINEDHFVGQAVWVDMPHMADAFPGAVMKAEIVHPADMGRNAQPGLAWVRQVATPAQPYPGEDGGWVSEQPLSRIYACR